ncbi:MAG: hypothetical protein N2507_01985 [Candidatus Bipolaricaulota bacterium]|nr:hypothetical protein [Candidatus Bipolaricaulota bacterium]MCX7844120.1 hypothetical protein [Candidatus Bipolaricaulota bacterium]MDW8152291.1 hypothetical protein [Candidatus Bipolaricaulota bacterium]
MKAKILVLLVLALGAGGLGGWAPHTVYVELLGVGILYSVNYEHRLSPLLSVGVGATQWELGLWGPPTTVTGLLGHLKLLLGQLRSHHLEVGVSLATFLPRPPLLLAPLWGYRFQPAAGGLVFRGTLLALVGPDGLLPFFGLSLGWAF